MPQFISDCDADSQLVSQPRIFSELLSRVRPASGDGSQLQRIFVDATTCRTPSYTANNCAPQNIGLDRYRAPLARQEAPVPATAATELPKATSRTLCPDRTELMRRRAAADWAAAHTVSSASTSRRSPSAARRHARIMPRTCAVPTTATTAAGPSNGSKTPSPSPRGQAASADALTS